MKLEKEIKGRQIIPLNKTRGFAVAKYMYFLRARKHKTDEPILVTGRFTGHSVRFIFFSKYTCVSDGRKKKSMIGRNNSTARGFIVLVNHA